MSTAAAEPLIVLPEIKQRSWALSAIVLVDALALELSLLLGFLCRYGLSTLYPIALGDSQYQGIALGILALPIALYLVGLYPGYGMSAVQRIRARVYATAAVFFVLFTWNSAFNGNQWSGGVLGFTMFFTLVLTPMLQAPFRRMLIRRGIFGLPVVIVGAGRTGASLAQMLCRELDIGWRPVGFLDNDSNRWGTVVEGVPVIGPLSAAGPVTHRVKVAVVAMPDLAQPDFERVRKNGFQKIVVVRDPLGVQSVWLASRKREGLALPEEQPERTGNFGRAVCAFNRLFKRLTDYCFALPLFLLCLPVMCLSAVLIRAASPGAAIFRQAREGKGGKQIGIYKLRTMYPDADSILREYLAKHPEERQNWNRYYKLRNDPRIIPGIGQFLRRYSLDELPQFWNVLRGDMSLVGPRPFPPYHLDNFSKSFRSLRSSVIPGVTGLWQVSERSNGDLHVQESNDTYYIRNWSLWLDVYILIRTMQSVVLAKGAY